MWLELYTSESHGDPDFNIPGIPQLRTLCPMSGYGPTVATHEWPVWGSQRNVLALA